MGERVTPAKVFVSYSHKNAKALERLMPFVRPLQRGGLLSAWADTDLEGGEDWKEKILEALATATTAVLLVCKDFVASDFIALEELPRLLAREAAGELTVIPVFLSPSLVGTTFYEFVDPRTGRKESLKLTKFQGYGTPEKPLSGHGWASRERLYQELGERLAALSGDGESRPSPLVPPPIIRTAAPAGPSQTYELTVRIESRGDGFDVSYQLPGGASFGHAPLSREELQQRAGPIASTLDTALSRHLLEHLHDAPRGWGETLWKILFGPDVQWDPVLRALFGRAPEQPRANPTWQPVRLRIATEEPLLAGLPWRLTAWSGQPLLDLGWTFATTGLAEPVADVQTTAPSRVLLVVPQVRGEAVGPHDSDHVRAVLEVLAKAWPTGREPGYVDVARTRAEVEAALRERPHLLYIYGCGKVVAGRPSLLLDGSAGLEPLALADLRRLFTAAGHTPAVIYLNAEGLSGSPTPDQLLGTDVPLVLWRRRPDWSADSTTTALLWLYRWLAKGEDPVAALHEVHREGVLSGGDACTLAVASGYRAWRTALYQGSAVQPSPSLRLDRDTPKALVRKHLEELARDPHRRVMALVAFASPGNSIAHLPEQLRHDLERSLAHLAEVRWVRLDLPIQRGNLRRDLEDELKLQLAAGPHETVSALLRRHSPRAVAPGRRPVLWINWGAYGNGPERPTEEQLGEWLRFASEFLGTHCPEDLRIVCTIALEVPEADYTAFAGQLQRYKKQPWCRTPVFRLSDLPPLDKVAEDHLLEYLVGSTCEPDIQAEVAERVILQTGGSFEETVALLDQAEKSSWRDLLTQLRSEQGKRGNRE